MKPNRKVVWFHRTRALLWAVVGIVSFTQGWQGSVVLVWIASLYANIATDWGAAEAADDRCVMTELHAIRTQLDALTQEAHGRGQ